MVFQLLIKRQRRARLSSNARESTALPNSPKERSSSEYIAKI
nr:MAG TPA: hypothetical protein [Caudoviricetes sp.]